MKSRFYYNSCGTFTFFPSLCSCLYIYTFLQKLCMKNRKITFVRLIIDVIVRKLIISNLFLKEKFLLHANNLFLRFLSIFSSSFNVPIWIRVYVIYLPEKSAKQKCKYTVMCQKHARCQK